MKKTQTRPKYLNLFQIRMPVTAVVSIAHRFSGFILVILIPFIIYAFQMSLESVQSYNKIISLLNYPLIKLLLVIVSWAIAHHLAAGIRFLLIDVDIGVSKANARRSAWIVHVVALSFGLYIAGLLL